MTITTLEKSFGKKTINDSYRSIQIGTPLTRTTSTSVFEYHQRTFNTSVWQPAILEVDYRLSTVINPKTDSAAFRSISAQTLRDIITSRTEEEFNREFILLDCRYNYEYNGGHIKYAINFHDNTLVHTLFYPDDDTEFRKMNARVPIFYCEFSQVRGPKMAHELRRHDRRRNEAVYPIVDYPEMYLLDGGYNNFYKLFKKESLCVPDRYIPMKSKKYSGILKKFSFHRTKSQVQKQQFVEDSLVMRRKRRAVRVDSGSSEWKIVCSGPTMTSTPARKPSLPVFPDAEIVKSTLAEDEFSKMQSWRQNINGIASTSEWDSSFETSITELELSSVLEEKIISTEFSFTGQSQAIKEMDLNRNLDSMSDFIASFSPGRQRYIREDIQIESIRESNVQPRGILRNPEPESESAKSNTVRAKSIPQLTELFGEKFLTKNSTRTPSRESHNRTSLEKSGQEEKKKIKEQKTVVAFGRTTKVDDSIPTAVKATATAKFPPIGGTAKEVNELKKTVEEHASTIKALESEVTLLKSQYEQITSDYQYVLELLEKQNDRILKIELTKTGPGGNQTQNQSSYMNQNKDKNPSQGISQPINVDSTIGLPNRMSKTKAPLDSIALVKNLDLNKEKSLSITVPDLQPKNQQETRQDKFLPLVAVPSESDELGKINSLVKNDPEFCRNLKEFLKSYKNEKNEADQRKVYRREYSERRRERFEDRVPRVRERLTVQREYCYSPSAPLSTTIDSTLRKIPDFNREEHVDHEKEGRNDHHRRHRAHHRREITPRVEEVSEEWSSSNEEEYVSRIHSNPRSPQESRIHDQTAGKENIPEVDNMEYTVMQDYYDEDDGLFEPSVNTRPTTNESRPRVADRLIQNRRR